MINLRDVHVFLVIVDEGGMSAASRKLKLPKSTVTRQLSRLEGELCTDLLNRTTRRLSLTDAGATFLPYARRLLDDSQHAENLVRRSVNGANGLLTISAPATFGRAFLAPQLASFRRIHPGVRVELRLTSVKESLARDRVDVAFRLGPLIDPTLAERKLGIIHFGLFASQAYLDKNAHPSSPQELAGHELIELRPPAGEQRLDLFCARKMVSVRYVPALKADDPESARAMCAAGGGIAPLPWFLVAEDLRRGNLVSVLQDWEPAAADLHLICDRRAVLPARVQAYVDFVLQTLGHSRPWEVDRRPQ